MLILVTYFVQADESISINTVPSLGKAPLEVALNLISSEEVISVSWDFESDGVEDSAELSPKHTYGPGKHTVSAKVTTATGIADVSEMINVEEQFSVSVIAAPSSGIAPLTVKFTTSVTEFPDKDTPFMYSWDFDNDGVVDSVEQNPSHTFENVGDFKVTLTVTDGFSSSTLSKVTKKIPILVNSYDSKIKIASYFPIDLQLKENQVTFLVANEGTETIKDISAKIIGEGVQHLSSTTISRLKPDEQDSLTVKMNVLKEGEISASVRIDEKIFPITFAVAEQVKVNKEELEADLQVLKEKLQVEEDDYYEKKADGYLVSEVFDTIKDVKDQLQDAQEQMLVGHLQEAQVSASLVGSAIADINYRLQDAQKPKQTLLLWLKENAVAITAIIAAVGTLSGLAVRVSKGAKKLGEDVKEKLTKKEEKKEVKEKQDISDQGDEDKESNQNIPEKEQEEIKEDSSGDKL